MQTENRRNGRLTDQAWLNTDGFVWLNFELKKASSAICLNCVPCCVQLLQGRELTPMGKLSPQNKNSSSCPHIEGVLAGAIFIQIQKYPEMDFLPC